MNDTELACRVEKLERSNKMLRAFFLGLVILAGIAVLMGSATNQASPILEAERFVLKDHAGRERGSFYASDSSWGIVLYNSDSSKGAAFIVSDFGSTAMLMNKRGKPGVAAMASEEANTLAVTDLKTNRTAMELKNNGQASGLRFLDEKGTDRVDMTLMQSGGSALLLNDAASRTRTVLQEEYPGFTTFDANGMFEWAAGFDGLSKADQERIKVLMQKLNPR